VGPLEQVASWPVPSAAVAVVGPDGVLESTGPVGTSYAWASVTKLLTALTVLAYVQDDDLHLDEPAGPAGSTVRHLLAHASGLPPEEGPALSPPGRRRVYSNAGFEVLGRLVEERTGGDFAEVVAGTVCRPLGMTATVLAGSPAHGARGPLTDLAALGRELLAPTLLGPELASVATTVAFPGLAGVLPGFGVQDPNDWGLGLEVRDGKSPHWTGSLNSRATFGHFGRSGSFLWVDPVARVACAGLADRDFGRWAAEAWPRLSDAVLAARPGGSPAPAPGTPSSRAPTGRSP